MSGKIDDILQRIRVLEEELENEMAGAAEKFRYTVAERKVLFEQSVAEYHRRLRKHWLRFIADASPRILLVSPVIYSMIIPLVVLDAALFIYQTLCFPMYGIKKARRSDFVVIDRHYLSYLNIFERFNCAYCGYATGLLAYARDIVARTESYWCPIKHARRIRDAHRLYGEFEDYGDAEGWRKRMGQSPETDVK